MRQLALMPQALPLSRGEAAARYAFDSGAEASASTWDADVLHACVCDSSWQARRSL